MDVKLHNHFREELIHNFPQLFLQMSSVIRYINDNFFFFLKMHAQLFSRSHSLNLLTLIETPFNTFANRADPDQAALVRAA